MCIILDRLFEEAKKSYITHQISCVISYRNKIISTGHNYSTVHKNSLKSSQARTSRANFQLEYVLHILILLIGLNAGYFKRTGWCFGGPNCQGFCF